MVVQGSDDAGVEVRERADVDDDASGGEFLYEPLTFLGADAVSDSVCPDDVKRRTHGRRACHLTRMGDRAEAALARNRKRTRERTHRFVIGTPDQPQPDDSAVAVPDRAARHLFRLVGGVDAGEVGRQPNLDAVSLLCLLCAVAVAGEYLVLIETSPQTGREDRLEVHGACEPASCAYSTTTRRKSS